MPYYPPSSATVTDATISTSDVATNNAATTKHGWLKKLDNSATNFMNGQGNWAAPGISAAGLNAGTSNPGSPTTNDLFFRTDLGLIIKYTGSAWHTAQLFTARPSAAEHILPATANGTQYTAMHGLDFDIYVDKWYASTVVLSTNNGTNFWTIALGDAIPTTNLGSFTTGSGPDTAGTKTNHEMSIGALLGTTSPDDLWVNTTYTKTLAPGNLYLISMFTYRLVVT